MAAATESRYFTTVNPPCCSCLDFWYRGHIRICKHVRRLREAEALLAANTARWAETEASAFTIAKEKTTSSDVVLGSVSV